ncbi:MAG: PPC domain-containing protein [Planctomycetes bacterium]|nr:PPC domain-containing protein [Planctomycetota bacterium]
MRRFSRILFFLQALSWSAIARAQPEPVLHAIYPPGGKAGSTFEVHVAGSNLDVLTGLHCRHQGFSFQHVEGARFRVTLARDVLPSVYDLEAVGRHGMSSPRAFVVGTGSEFGEAGDNDELRSATAVALNASVNGRIERDGDQDHYRFAARRGQRVVMECWAERIDSPLRAVLEMYDALGKRLAVNRGYWGIDPLIDFRVPADGEYVVRVFDLTFSGGEGHVYRLDIDTQPRVAFTVPAVLQRGTTAKVAVYGWNLGSEEPAAPEAMGLECREMEIAAPKALDGGINGLRLRSAQVTVDGFAYHFPGASAPVMIGVTDVPVVADRGSNHSAGAAQTIEFPCEVSGQLSGPNEQDWFAITARRGEVLWLEVFGERIGSPVDLDLSVLDVAGRELSRFSDELRDVGGQRFSAAHLDPVGRFVAASDGRYFLRLRNVTGGLDDDPRRVYRLSVRREEPDFHMVAISPAADTPGALNVARGGRALIELLAYRSRGQADTLRVSALNLPPGLSCPDVWLGPGVNAAPLILTADANAAPLIGAIDLVARSVGDGRLDERDPLDDPTDELASAGLVQYAARARVVRSGAMVQGKGRLTSEIVAAVTGEAPLLVTADAQGPKHTQLYGDLPVRPSQGSVLDVAVEVQRRDSAQGDVRLQGVGLPELVRNEWSVIPAGQTKGYISFYLPPTLPVGRYTFAVRAEMTTAEVKGKTRSITAYSNAVSFDVRPARFVVAPALDAPRKVRRGQYVQLNYSGKRCNGFIGKIHTDLEAPGGVVGLRVRGVTFVGGTDTGVLQIVANDDAPLGRQPFLRLDAIGTLEDQPIFQGSCFVDLEIVE